LSSAETKGQGLLTHCHWCVTKWIKLQKRTWASYRVRWNPPKSAFKGIYRVVPLLILFRSCAVQLAIPTWSVSFSFENPWWCFAKSKVGLRFFACVIDNERMNTNSICGIKNRGEEKGKRDELHLFSLSGKIDNNSPRNRVILIGVATNEDAPHC